MNSTESVANWCAVDTKTGKITVMLEENYCFDAEVYADELDLSKEIVFRDDQRSEFSSRYPSIYLEWSNILYHSQPGKVGATQPLCFTA